MTDQQIRHEIRRQLAEVVLKAAKQEQTVQGSRDTLSRLCEMLVDTANQSGLSQDSKLKLLESLYDKLIIE